MPTSTVIDKLRDLLGPDGVSSHSDDLRAHSSDRSGRAGKPDMVVWPKTPEEVAGILRTASEDGVPVTPRGAGRGLLGGAVPKQGGVVLSTDRMNRILSVSVEDLIAVVEPGVDVAEFQKHVEALGVFYPADLAAQGRTTLGGAVAESASGLRAIKYGGTRNYVMGMKIALPTGEILKTGARTLKCVTGYDISRLMSGSLGTLGVITELYLKLLPVPEERVTTIAVFDDCAKAAGASTKVLETGILPSALELLDSVTLRSLGKLGEAEVPDGVDAVLLVETDGLSGAAKRQADRVAAVCRDSGAREAVEAASPKEAEAFWDARRAVLDAVGRGRRQLVIQEVNVPRSRVAELVPSLKSLAAAAGTEMAVFGHVGEARLHPTIPTGLEDEEDGARLERVVGRIAEEVRSLGGRMGPERNVGLGGRSFLKRPSAGEAQVLSKRLKDAFDPNGVMNPGTLF